MAALARKFSGAEKEDKTSEARIKVQVKKKLGSLLKRTKKTAKRTAPFVFMWKAAFDSLRGPRPSFLTRAVFSPIHEDAREGRYRPSAELEGKLRAGWASNRAVDSSRSYNLQNEHL